MCDKRGNDGKLDIKSELTSVHVGCKPDWPVRCVIRSWGVDASLRGVAFVQLAKIKGGVPPKILRKLHLLIAS